MRIGKKNDAWASYEFTTADKTITVSGPEITFYVDYDDVDHPAVVKELRRMLALLNDAEEKKA